MRPYFSSALFVLCMASVACSSTIDVGQANGDGGGGSDAKSGFDEGDGGADASGKDATTAPPSTTKDGVSCANADLPPAASACSIPGSYTVTESMCSSTNATCMDPQTSMDFVWTADVTLTGTTVKLTNGTNRLMHCVLTPPCTCVDSSGDMYHFTATGFASVGRSSCQGSATQPYLTTGVKL